MIDRWYTRHLPLSFSKKYGLGVPFPYRLGHIQRFFSAEEWNWISPLWVGQSEMAIFLPGRLSGCIGYTMVFTPFSSTNIVRVSAHIWSFRQPPFSPHPAELLHPAFAVILRHCWDGFEVGCQIGNCTRTHGQWIIVGMEGGNWFWDPFR